uniref:Uncharacterized protein (Hypothetical protein, conserved) n=1 Tax=Trypanosoma brucei brucei (strain 927/4 GUTat10.1) TaxID=185431 RepID=B2ZWD8_TRYB2|nr:hypothetical protein Tb927.5.480b [Trypanosoma brucei brucei TREU927]
MHAAGQRRLLQSPTPPSTTTEERRRLTGTGTGMNSPAASTIAVTYAAESNVMAPTRRGIEMAERSATSSEPFSSSVAEANANILLAGRHSGSGCLSLNRVGAANLQREGNSNGNSSHNNNNDNNNNNNNNVYGGGGNQLRRGYSSDDGDGDGDGEQRDAANASLSTLASSTVSQGGGKEKVISVPPAVQLVPPAFLQSSAPFGESEDVCGVCLEAPPEGCFVELLCCGNILCVGDAQLLGNCPFCRRGPLMWSITR